MKLVFVALILCSSELNMGACISLRLRRAQTRDASSASICGQVKAMSTHDESCPSSFTTVESKSTADADSHIEPVGIIDLEDDAGNTVCLDHLARQESGSQNVSVAVQLSRAPSTMSVGEFSTSNTPVRNFNTAEALVFGPNIPPELLPSPEIVTLKELANWKATMHRCDQCDEWAEPDSSGTKCSNCSADLERRSILRVQKACLLQRITGKTVRQSLGDDLVFYNPDWTNIVFDD